MTTTEQDFSLNDLEVRRLTIEPLPPFTLIVQDTQPYYEIDLLALATPIRHIFVDKGVTTIAMVQELFCRQGQKPAELTETRTVVEAYERFARELRLRHSSVETYGNYANSVVDQYRHDAPLSSPYRGTFYIDARLTERFTHRGLSWADISAISRVEEVLARFDDQNIHIASTDIEVFNKVRRLIQSQVISPEALTLYIDIQYPKSQNQHNTSLSAFLNRETLANVTIELESRLVINEALEKLGVDPRRQLSRLIVDNLLPEQIAARLGLEISEFVDLCSEFGLKVSGDRRHSRLKMDRVLGTENPRGVLIRALNANSSQRDAAQALGVAQSELLKWIKKLGIKKDDLS